MRVVIVKPEYICNAVNMISVNDALPPLFKNVLVFGKIKPAGRWDKLYFSCPGYFIARRWSGLSSASYHEENGEWDKTYFDWVTNDDYPLFDVTHWMPEPKHEPNQRC